MFATALLPWKLLIALPFCGVGAVVVVGLCGLLLSRSLLAITFSASSLERNAASG